MDSSSPWGESYIKDLPPFAGSKIAEESSGKILTMEEKRKKSVNLMKDALSAESFDPKQDFQMIQEYATLRGACLGIGKPVNIYLRYEDFVETPTGSMRRETRIDPTTGGPYEGSSWGWQTRAFHAEDGIYLDFLATPDRESTKPINEQDGVLRSYEKAYELINFMYSCEHELQHEVQDQRLKNKEISYDALRISKDQVVIAHILPTLNNGRNFYMNAHDDFYIEDDANKTASEFLYDAIPADSTLARRIVNPDAPAKYQHDLLAVCMSREKEGQVYHKEYNFRVPENRVKIPKKEHRGSAEEIISNLCDDAFAAYPDFLKVYPALALEYNQDGTRRSLDEIKDAMNSLLAEGEQEVGGQKIPARNLRIAYYKIIKNLRQGEVASE